MLFKLLFVLLSLCLYREDVAKGGLSGSLQSEVEMSDKTEKLFISSMVEFENSELAKLGCHTGSKCMRMGRFGGHYMQLLTFPCSLHGT